MKKIILVLLSLLLVGCGAESNAYCPPKEAAATIVEFQNLNERWMDVFQLANATSRNQLPNVINTMQSIKRDANSLEVPECLQKTKQNMAYSMERGIDAFMAFMSDQSDSIITNHLVAMNGAMSDAIREMSNLNKCLPNCKRP